MFTMWKFQLVIWIGKSFISYPHLPETVQKVLAAPLRRSAELGRRTILGKIPQRGLVNNFYRSQVLHNDYFQSRFHDTRWVVRRMLGVSKADHLRKLCVFDKSGKQLHTFDVALLFIEEPLFCIAFCFSLIKDQKPAEYARLQAMYMEEFKRNPSKLCGVS